MSTDNHRVSDVAMISNTEFDQILVAVKHESLAKKIIDDLSENYSVPRNCITWKQPKEIYILDT